MYSNAVDEMNFLLTPMSLYIGKMQKCTCFDIARFQTPKVILTLCKHKCLSCRSSLAGGRQDFHFHLIPALMGGLLLTRLAVALEQSQSQTLELHWGYQPEQRWALHYPQLGLHHVLNMYCCKQENRFCEKVKLHTTNHLCCTYLQQLSTYCNCQCSGKIK